MPDIDRSIVPGLTEADPEIHVWEIFADGTVVSSLIFQHFGDECQVLEVETHWNHRRQGYAKLLITTLLAELPADASVYPGPFSAEGRAWLLPIFQRDPRCHHV